MRSEDWEPTSRKDKLGILVIVAFIVFLLSLAGWSDNAKAASWQRSTASAYGPGLWGNRTACGQTLTRSTVGVAHRYYRCGTRLRFRVNGHTITARVIDRGPYISGRTFDLTQRTVQLLGYRDAYAWGVRGVWWQRA
jgi:rare lipoprotein A (peptidoglycan hydrolase)